MAHEYKATVSWKRPEGEAFTDLKFSRGHQWSFDGGITVPGSSSPHVGQGALFASRCRRS